VSLVAFNGDDSAILKGQVDAACAAAYAAHGPGTADRGGYLRVRLKLHGRLLTAVIFSLQFFIKIRTAR